MQWNFKVLYWAGNVHISIPFFNFQSKNPKPDLSRSKIQKNVSWKIPRVPSFSHQEQPTKKFRGLYEPFPLPKR